MDLDLDEDYEVAPIDYDTIQAPQFVDFEHLKIADPEDDVNRARSFFEQNQEQGKDDGEFEGRISQHDAEEEDMRGTEVIPNSLPTAAGFGIAQGQADTEIKVAIDELQESKNNEIGSEPREEEGNDHHEQEQEQLEIPQTPSLEIDLRAEQPAGVVHEVDVAVAGPTLEVTVGGNDENVDCEGGAQERTQGDGVRVHQQEMAPAQPHSGIPVAILKKMDARVTLPKPFQFQSMRKKPIAQGQDMFTFKARPAPVKVLHGPTGLKDKPEIKFTIPVSPHFASDDRIRSRHQRVSVSALASNGTKENVEPKPVGDAPSSAAAGRGRRSVSVTPGRTFGRGRSPSPAPGLRVHNPSAATTVLKPFSFEEREKERKRAKEEKLAKEKAEVPSYVFHANPIPAYKHTATLPRKPTTTATATKAAEN